MHGSKRMVWVRHKYEQWESIEKLDARGSRVAKAW